MSSRLPVVLMFADASILSREGPEGEVCTGSSLTRSNMNQNSLRLKCCLLQRCVPIVHHVPLLLCSHVGGLFDTSRVVAAIYRSYVG